MENAAQLLATLTGHSIHECRMFADTAAEVLNEAMAEGRDVPSDLIEETARRYQEKVDSFAAHSRAHAADFALAIFKSVLADDQA